MAEIPTNVNDLSVEDLLALAKYKKDKERLDLREKDKEERDKKKALAKEEIKRKENEEKEARLNLLTNSFHRFASKYMYLFNAATSATLYFVRKSLDNMEVEIIIPAADREATDAAPLLSKSLEVCQAIKDEFAALVMEYQNNMKESKHHVVLKPFAVEREVMVKVQMNIPQENILRKMPVPITNSKHTLSTCYFDLNTIIDIPTPCWDEILLTVNYPEQLMAFFFSIVYEKHFGKQICAVCGTANSGKTTMLNAVRDWIGGNRNSSTITDTEMLSQFIGAKLLGKRLILNADCKKQFMIQSSELLHQMTGGDPIKVEGKFKVPFDITLRPSIIILSNRPMIIEAEDNQIIRLLPIRIRSDTQRAGRDDEFAEALRMEVPGMLFKARQFYEKHCVRSHIQIDAKAYAENFDDYHYKFQTIWGKYQRLNGARVLHDSLFTQVMEIMDLDKNLSPHDRRTKITYFWRILQSKFNTEMVSEIEDGQERRYIVGIAKIKDVELQAAHTLLQKEDSL